MFDRRYNVIARATLLVVTLLVVTLLVVTLVPITLWAQNSDLPLKAGQDRAEEIGKLVTVLQSEAELFDKVLACKRLAVIGDKTAVPPLAALLDDEKLAHYARYGLEPISDPAVDRAFRDALGDLQGGHLVGVVNSIGNRRDASAVGALEELLGADDSSVAGAAATALGRIGNPQSAELLTKALGTAPEAIQSAVGDGCVTCAELLFDEGNAETAIGLYDALRGADVAKHLRLAGTRSAILARKSEGVPLLIEQLKSEDDHFFAVGLGSARELKEGDITGALLAQLKGASEKRRLLLILALGDTQDTKATAAVTEAAGSDSSELRVAAIGVLAKLGDAGSVPLLLKAAIGGDPNVAAAAQATLAKIPGKDVDEAIAATLNEAGDSQRIAVELVGKRRIVAAVPALFKAAENSDPSLRLAALKSLGETIGPEDLPSLTSRLAGPQNEDQAAAVRDALKAASIRMPDREECAGRLADCIEDAPQDVKTFLFELLADVGGDTALAAVTGYARFNDDATQDLATQTLGAWTGADAADALLDIAKDDHKYKIRTLRGYIRIIRQFAADEQKPAMCAKAMAVAQRVQEKQLILEALGRVPSTAALSQTVSHLSDDRLTKEASFAAVAIAEKIVDAHPAAVARAMKQVVDAGASGETARRAKELLAKAKR